MMMLRFYNKPIGTVCHRDVQEFTILPLLSTYTFLHSHDIAKKIIVSSEITLLLHKIFSIFLLSN